MPKRHCRRSHVAVASSFYFYTRTGENIPRERKYSPFTNKMRRSVNIHLYSFNWISCTYSFQNIYTAQLQFHICKRKTLKKETECQACVVAIAVWWWYVREFIFDILTPSAAHSLSVIFRRRRGTVHGKSSRKIRVRIHIWLYVYSTCLCICTASA